MYVAPRPEAVTDPLYAIRLATACAVGFAIIPLVQPAMPAMVPPMLVGMMASMRQTFDPKKAFGAPIALGGMIALMALIFGAARNMPGLLLTLVWIFYFAGFFLVQKTGNPAGMLVAIATAMCSIMAMESPLMLGAIRDGMLQCALFAAILTPCLYAIFPTRSDEILVEVYTPAPGRHLLAAAIRATVLLALTIWLYTIGGAANLILAVAAVFVLVFPTRETLFAEAKERLTGTLMGVAACFGALALVNLSAHFLIVLGAAFLMALGFARRMMDGRHPSMVYQYALSCGAGLMAGALAAQEPGYASYTRIVLTMIGVAVAALATALLEGLFGVHEAPEPKEV